MFNYYGSWNLGQETWEIKRVLDKTIYGNIDSVTYQLEYCRKKAIRTGDTSWSYSYYFNTISERHNFTLPPADTMDIRKLPNELLDNHSNTYKYLGFYNSVGRAFM